MNAALNKSMLVSIFASVAFPVLAATTTVSSSVTWKAEAIKKTDVELNVFASNDSLQFKWDPTNKRFSTASSSLTVQAAGKVGTTSYQITSQLTRNKLTHVSGAAIGTVSISSAVGGIAMDVAPVSILEGDRTKGVTLAASGMNGMNLEFEGPNAATNGTYHEAERVKVDFNILSGTDSKNSPLSRGSAEAGLDKLADGTYEGVVEMNFVASWTKS
ncbi:common pilus major fimbrillin subunit EcpA [Solimicrobium silvestre]|uniref:Common pilus major fimbrillin subunit EcpA n=1 Tax=Solimicrobium silvestre TaxID=2099400 RepID=A0A2S9GUR0_9BURK|nr:common pilus major fimbrillin subunit EcpA [Solimicrobium silvestre]PRC91449.1 hypothetical protein S2091_3864 [Solimicrobium silvestre]